MTVRLVAVVLTALPWGGAWADEHGIGLLLDGVAEIGAPD